MATGRTLADGVRLVSDSATAPRRGSARPGFFPLVVAGSVLVLCLGANDAAAATLGGFGTSVGLFAAIATWMLLRGWQAHLGIGGLSTLAGLVALAVGAALLWRAAAAGGWRGGLRMSGPADATAPVAATIDTEAVALPASVDRDLLVADLRRHFIDLQTAWDLGARERLNLLTTPDMLEELCAARSAGSEARCSTDVLSLDVRLLLFEERETAQVVCAEFSGMVRETLAAAPSPFREFWMLTRGCDAASGWRLARHQALL